MSKNFIDDYMNCGELTRATFRIDIPRQKNAINEFEYHRNDIYKKKKDSEDALACIIAKIRGVSCHQKFDKNANECISCRMKTGFWLNSEHKDESDVWNHVKYISEYCNGVECSDCEIKKFCGVNLRYDNLTPAAWIFNDTPLTFERVLPYLKNGFAIRRDSWSDASYVNVDVNGNIVRHDDKEYLWLMTSTDIFAEDWRVINND